MFLFSAVRSRPLPPSLLENTKPVFLHVHYGSTARINIIHAWQLRDDLERPSAWSVAQIVVQGSNTPPETCTSVSRTVNCNANSDDNVFAENDNRSPGNVHDDNGDMLLRQPESPLVLFQKDTLGRSYSTSTVSAMSRILGQNDNPLLLLAGGQAVVRATAQLLDVLKAGSGTSLEECSAALALLCDAGQYDVVVQYGSPLLKAASAAAPFSPLGVVKQPVPDLEQLIADLALSVALAHISLAGGPAVSGISSGGNTAIGAIGCTSSGQLDLEGMYSHLESALQVLERYSVAPPLRQEVAFCLQSVAAVLVEEVLRSTPPVVQPAATGEWSQTGSLSGMLAAAGARSGEKSDPSASLPSSQVSPSAASAGARMPTVATAARRAKAIAKLRSVLWRGGPGANQLQQMQQVQRGDSSISGAVQGAGGATGVTSSLVDVGGISVSWVPGLTPEERLEVMSSLRGLLAASEYIAVYGPAANRQKPFTDVQLLDQELYDVAIAHLAQGVSTGWPQHVLQALSYFERLVQQQGSVAAVARSDGAVDVSFERSVCEILLGRRTTVVGSAELPLTSPPSQPAAALGAVSATTPLPYSFIVEDWDHADEAALLRRLEAQLMMAARGVALEAEDSAEGGVSFQVDEWNDIVAAEGVLPPGTATSVTAVDAWCSDTSAVVTSSRDSAAPQHHQQSVTGDRSRTSKVGDDDVARKYGWAQSWLELSVMPCFPETAGAGSVSLARWFADPRVILFNKLLAVRSGEAQVTAALGSAVAHVSDASRQRLWKLWQAAASAISSATGQSQSESESQHRQQLQQPRLATAAASETEKEYVATDNPKATAADENMRSVELGGAAPQNASGLLAQSRAALQDVAPRAAAAASAVAIAVGTAAARSPRAVAAAAGWMVPFGLGARWGVVERSDTAGVLAAAPMPASSGIRTGVTAQALPSTAASPATFPTNSSVSSTSTGHSRGPDDLVSSGKEEQLSPGRDPNDNHGPPGYMSKGSCHHHHQQQQQHPPWISNTNNVVPFTTGGAGVVMGSALHSTPTTLPPVPQPLAGGLVDVALAPPRAGSDRIAVVDVDVDVDAANITAVGSALWAPDAEGHLRPRPRMVTGVVQRSSVATASSILGRMMGPSAAPLNWASAGHMDFADSADAQEAMDQEDMRRIWAVAFQAVCLGALAAFVGVRFLCSGALHTAASKGLGGEAAAPMTNASSSQVAAAACGVAQWLASTGGSSPVAHEVVGQWPLASRGAELLTFDMTAPSFESVGRLASRLGSCAQLDEAAAAVLLRGWAAARAAAAALADPRDRTELLSTLMGGRALKLARAEVERNCCMGRRIHLQRIDVEVEQLQSRAGADGCGDAEVVATAVVVTAGTETHETAPLPLSYSTREHLAFTFRRTSGELQYGNVAKVLQWADSAPAGAATRQAAVWRLVDVRGAPLVLTWNVNT